eukprot:FR736150.1.p1 GENE.FR736150.1~~FR736150.1.p1  ORF type:complete len:114 (+),score=25.15 FR736150.1:150-491(+)
MCLSQAICVMWVCVWVCGNPIDKTIFRWTFPRPIDLQSFGGHPSGGVVLVGFVTRVCRKLFALFGCVFEFVGLPIDKTIFRQTYPRPIDLQSFGAHPSKWWCGVGWVCDPCWW